MSLFVWNRIGPARCNECGKKLRVGQIVEIDTPYGWTHYECPTSEPMSMAFETMRRWTQNDLLPTTELVKAAKAIIEHYEPTGGKQ